MRLVVVMDRILSQDLRSLFQISSHLSQQIAHLNQSSFSL